jgi:hypothetical protein
MLWLHGVRDAMQSEPFLDARSTSSNENNSVTAAAAAAAAVCRIIDVPSS